MTKIEHQHGNTCLLCNGAGQSDNHEDNYDPHYDEEHVYRGSGFDSGVVVCGRCQGTGLTLMNQD